ncbi:hypothetical protein ALO57_200120 [Pseudomonas coronafaciens pv. oryzae]|nr:hypothetical protein ALO57_200120 [Pseudomonas coronafaciens pv. oryzae]
MFLAYSFTSCAGDCMDFNDGLLRRYRLFLAPEKEHGIAKGLHALEEVGYIRDHARSVVLDPSTGEQEFTRVKDDRPLPGRQPTGSRMVLEKPASAGFLLGARKSRENPDHLRSAFLLRRFSRCFSRSLRRRISWRISLRSARIIPHCTRNSRPRWLLSDKRPSSGKSSPSA